MRKSFAPSSQRNRWQTNEIQLQETPSTCSSTSGKVSNSIRSASSILDLLNESTNNSDSPSFATCQQNATLERPSSPSINHLSKAVKYNNSMKRYADHSEVENFQPIPTTDSTTSTKRIYNVVWGKLSKKKHKTWEGDGVVEIGLQSVVLKDCDGKCLGSTRGVKTEQLEEGSRVIVGGKEIELIELVTSGGDEEATKKNKSQPPTSVNPSTLSRPLKRPKLMASRMPKAPPVNMQGAVVMPSPPSEHQQTSLAESTVDDDAVIDEILSV